MKFSVGDGSVLRGASKAVPAVALDAAVLRLTPVGEKDGAAVGLQGAAFQLDPIGVLSSPVIVRVEIDYSSLSMGKSQDWRYRVVWLRCRRARWLSRRIGRARTCSRRRS